MDTCVAESPRIFYYEVVCSRTVKLPGGTLNGTAAESCFSALVAVKRTTAHPVRRIARHKHQKELRSTSAFCVSLYLHTVSALCICSRHGLFLSHGSYVDLGNTMNVLQQLLPSS